MGLTRQHPARQRGPCALYIGMVRPGTRLTAPIGGTSIIFESGFMEAPWISVRETVRDEWIDFNGHMTNAAYVTAFDIASVAWLHRIGIDPEYRARERCSTFALELHTVFHRELP